MSTKLYIIRHGETYKNDLKNRRNSSIINIDGSNKVDKIDKVDKVDKNKSDLSSLLIVDKNCKLNQTGKIQSNIVGDYLSDAKIVISAVYSSPLLRAVETADIITKHLGNCTSDIEVEFIVDDRLFSGKKDKVISKEHLTHDILELLNEIVVQYEGKNILIVTHNHIIYIIGNIINETDGQMNQNSKAENCSISCVDLIHKYDENMESNKIDAMKILYWCKKIKVSYELI